MEKRETKKAPAVIAYIALAASLIVIAGAILFSACRSSETYRREHAAYTPAAGNNGTKEGIVREYFQQPDGTWVCEGHTYKYRLEITGRMANAVADSTFVYLSNLEEITFDRAWKAAGLSSYTDDYFDADEAVLAECRTEKG